MRGKCLAGGSPQITNKDEHMNSICNHVRRLVGHRSPVCVTNTMETVSGRLCTTTKKRESTELSATVPTSAKAR